MTRSAALNDYAMTMAEVLKRLGLKSRTTLWALRRRDPTFPKPIMLAPNVLRISERELEAWIAAQPRSNLYARPEPGINRRRPHSAEAPKHRPLK